MQALLRKLTRCGVCGFAEIETDEVFHRELVVLAECPRCVHRWTSVCPSGPAPARVRLPQRVHREVATAA